MKNLNVAIEDELAAAVKAAARKEGMLLGAWVRRLLREATAESELGKVLRESEADAKPRELTHEPLEEK